MIRSKLSLLGAAVALACGLGAATAQAAPAKAVVDRDAEAVPALRQVNKVDFPKYSGDYDRWGVDLKRKRVYVAGEYQAYIEVLDATSGKHIQTVTGFTKPQGFVYIPAKDRLVVADSKGGTKILDGDSLKFLDTLQLRPGANTLGYEPSLNRLYVQTGGAKGGMKESFVQAVDFASMKPVGELKFDTDGLKGLTMEKTGNRMFMSVTGQNAIAVVDKKSLALLNTWPITEAAQPSPMDFDETHGRLFVVTRSPFKLLVLDTNTGKTLASFTAPERANDVRYDRANGRIYVAGDYYVGVYQQKDADHYAELTRIPTAYGAKTAILVPELNKYFVAVAPGPDKFGGAMLTFDVRPARK